MSNFGGAVVKAETYDFALLGVPFDQKSSFMYGAAKGPDALREASTGKAVNPETETGWNLKENSVVVDKGNIKVEGIDFKGVFVAIEKAVDETLGKKAVPIVMGGDHSISYPVFKALSRHYPSVDILHFDAHPDMYTSFRGDRFSHACPFARILEEGGVNRLIQIGLRTVTREQREFGKDFPVQMFEMKDLNQIPCLEITRPLYISFDMDALDPAFAPGVSHHEPGGLSTRQVLNILHSLKADIIGMDCVELNPERDPSGITAAAGVKVIMEVMGMVLESRRK